MIIHAKQPFALRARSKILILFFVTHFQYPFIEYYILVIYLQGAIVFIFHLDIIKGYSYQPTTVIS